MGRQTKRMFSTLGAIRLIGDQQRANLSLPSSSKWQRKRWKEKICRDLSLITHSSPRSSYDRKRREKKISYFYEILTHLNFDDNK